MPTRYFPLLFSLALLAGLGNQVHVNSMGDARAIAFIHQMEADGRPASEIVASLVDDGRTVRDAPSLVAAVARSPAVRARGTLFGMCMAPDKNEVAEEVGGAAQASAGPDDLDVARVVSSFRAEECRMFYPLRGGTAEPLRPIDPISPST